MTIFGAQDITEAEFFLLEAMECYVIVHHPYRTLTQIVADATQLLEPYQAIAWKVINDSYHTDMCLTVPPHMIALAALYIAAMDDGQGRMGEPSQAMQAWLADLFIDTASLQDTVRQIFDLYSTWDEVNWPVELVRLLDKQRMPAQQAVPGTTARNSPLSHSQQQLYMQYHQQLSTAAQLHGPSVQQQAAAQQRSSYAETQRKEAEMSVLRLTDPERYAELQQERYLTSQRAAVAGQQRTASPATMKAPKR
eukprot:Opistho-2@67046